MDLCRGPHVPNTGQVESIQNWWNWRGHNCVVKSGKWNALPTCLWHCLGQTETLISLLHRLEKLEISADHRKLGEKAWTLFHLQMKRACVWSSGTINGWRHLSRSWKSYIRDVLFEYGLSGSAGHPSGGRSLWEKPVIGTSLGDMIFQHSLWKSWLRG